MHFIPKKHKHHIHTLLIVLVGTFAFFGLSILWDYELINLPPSVIHYGRTIDAALNSQPGASSKLNLKFHRQEHSLSCEAATLKMVLDYHGMNIPEAEILEKMPWDKTPRSGDVWGDPNLGFVGDIDGKMMVDGYGIHWGPLAVTASHWKQSKIIKNGLAGDLVEHISAGRPVIVWGYLGRGQPVSWKTLEGETVYGINGEHTRVVYGYKGSADNPEGFMVMDPTYGSMYWEKEKFMRNWDGLGRMGLVVYP
jgi:uncharacterized protein YvpB